MATQFAALYQLFFVRLVIFFVCFTVFTYLVRGEIAERSLHFYLMAPLRRDVFLIGKYIAGLIAASIIVLASLDVGGIIILESALSFLGLGIQPPTPSWGGMLSAGRGLMRNAPHIAVAPGVAISITVLAFNLLGDGLRDALDPRQRE